MKPTAAQAAEAIREFGHLVWDEVFRHPGPDWDEHDREAWRTTCRRLVDAYKRQPGLLCRWNEAGHAWAAPAWAVRFALRNAKFRPTWAEVADSFAQHLGADKVESVTGADAAARTVYAAPPPPEAPALPAGQSSGTYAPPWLEEFRRTVSRDQGGLADRVLLAPMMHLSDGDALRAVRAMADGKRQWSEEREASAQKAAEKRAAAATRQTGGDALGMVCRTLQASTHSSPLPPQWQKPDVAPEDDPVLRRGHHTIAEVGQEAPVGPTRPRPKDEWGTDRQTDEEASRD